MNIDAIIEEHIQVLEDKASLLKKDMDISFEKLSGTTHAQAVFAQKFMTPVLEFIRKGAAELPVQLLANIHKLTEHGDKVKVVTSAVPGHYQRLWYLLGQEQ